MRKLNFFTLIGLILLSSLCQAQTEKKRSSFAKIVGQNIIDNDSEKLFNSFSTEFELNKDLLTTTVASYSQAIKANECKLVVSEDFSLQSRLARRGHAFRLLWMTKDGNLPYSTAISFSKDKNSKEYILTYLSFKSNNRTLTKEIFNDAEFMERTKDKSKQASQTTGFSKEERTTFLKAFSTAFLEKDVEYIENQLSPNSSGDKEKVKKLFEAYSDYMNDNGLEIKWQIISGFFDNEYGYSRDSYGFVTFEEDAPNRPIISIQIYPEKIDDTIYINEIQFYSYRKSLKTYAYPSGRSNIVPLPPPPPPPPPPTFKDGQ